MNNIEATISSIENSDNLHIIEFQVKDQYLYMMSLELPNIEVGLHVKLAVKPMNIGIAKRFSGSFSFSNKLCAIIKDIEIGNLLCSVKTDFNGVELESIITKKVIKDMHLKVGDSVVLFIKASDISIKEVL
jgi:molybdopterin-binding protein